MITFNHLPPSPAALRLIQQLAREPPLPPPYTDDPQRSLVAYGSLLSCVVTNYTADADAVLDFVCWCSQFEHADQLFNAIYRGGMYGEKRL